MQWLVIVELSGAVGAKQVHEAEAKSPAGAGSSCSDAKPRSTAKSGDIALGGSGRCGRCSARSRSAPRGLSPAGAA